MEQPKSTPANYDRKRRHFLEIAMQSPTLVEHYQYVLDCFADGAKEVDDTRRDPDWTDDDYAHLCADLKTLQPKVIEQYTQLNGKPPIHGVYDHVKREFVEKIYQTLGL
jgi:hypothetical protein